MVVMRHHRMRFLPEATLDQKAHSRWRRVSLGRQAETIWRRELRRNLWDHQVQQLQRASRRGLDRRAFRGTKINTGAF